VTPIGPSSDVHDSGNVPVKVPVKESSPLIFPRPVQECPSGVETKVTVWEKSRSPGL
jgi:hypothetical protein